MQYIPTDSEIYQCLSKVLLVIKRKLKQLINECPTQHKKTTQNDLDQQIVNLIFNIRKLIQPKSSFLSIFQRFLSRVNQLVKEIKDCVTKNKVKLHVILKKMQIVSKERLNNQNFQSIVCKLLEIMMENQNSLQKQTISKFKTEGQMKQADAFACLYQSSNLTKSQLQDKNQGLQVTFQSSNHLETSNLKQKKDQKPRFQEKQNNNNDNNQAIEKIQLQDIQQKKMNRTYSSVQENSIIWEVKTPSLIQSNLMRPQTYRDKCKLRSARSVRSRTTVESEQNELKTEKYKISFYNTCKLRQKRILPINLNFITIDSFPDQKLDKERICIKKRHFYFKSIEQNKFRSEYFQQRSRKNWLKTLTSDML